MSTFLVTGAAGFIGAAVAKRLKDEGNEVVTIDNLSTGYVENIPEGVEFYEGNVYDEKIIEDLKKYKFDCIFHIAGQSSGEISYDNPVYDLQTNTQSTLMLLKMALATGCKKFIYASSMSVYGDKLDGPAFETDNPHPKSFYGVGKLASEHYLRIYEDYGMACTSLRLCNTYGPGQNLANMRQGMVSIFLKQALDGQKIHVKGSPERFRDITFIDDVVDAFVASYNRESTAYKCFNVTGNKKITVGELVNTMIEIVGGDIEVEYSGSTPGDQFGVYGDNQAIFDDIAWKPKYDLKSGLRVMVDWAREVVNS